MKSKIKRKYAEGTKKVESTLNPSAELYQGFGSLATQGGIALQGTSEITKPGAQSLAYAGQGLSLGSSIGSAFGPVGTGIGAGVGALVGGTYGFFNGLERARNDRNNRTARFKQQNDNLSSDLTADANQMVKPNVVFKKGVKKIDSKRVVEVEGREPIFSAPDKNGNRTLIHYDPTKPTHAEGGVKATVVPKMQDGKKSLKAKSDSIWNTDPNILKFRNNFKKQFGEQPNIDEDTSNYNYRAAMLAGARPDATNHWPSDYKGSKNPRLILNGVNTKTGQPVPKLGEGTKKVSAENKPKVFIGGTDRTHYDSRLERVYLENDSYFRPEVLKHEFAHHKQKLDNRSTSYENGAFLRSAKLPQRDDEYYAHYNRRGNDYVREVNKQASYLQDPNKSTYALSREFVDDRLNKMFGKSADYALYDDPTTLEGEAEVMAKTGKKPYKVGDIPEYKKGVKKLSLNSLIKGHSQSYEKIEKNESPQMEKAELKAFKKLKKVEPNVKFEGGTKKISLKKNNNQPTTADSLALYNNTLNFEQALKNNNYKILKPNFNRVGSENGFGSRLATPLEKKESIENWNDKSIKRLAEQRKVAAKYKIEMENEIKNSTRDSRKKYVQENIMKGLNDYFKPVNENQFFQREMAIDSRVNEKLPATLYDKRILPQQHLYFGNEIPSVFNTLNPFSKTEAHDIVDIIKYDPIAVKPVSMLTPSERIEREKKYGKINSTPEQPIQIIKSKPSVIKSKQPIVKSEPRTFLNTKPLTSKTPQITQLPLQQRTPQVQTVPTRNQIDYPNVEFDTASKPVQVSKPIPKQRIRPLQRTERVSFGTSNNAPFNNGKGGKGRFNVFEKGVRKIKMKAC